MIETQPWVAALCRRRAVLVDRLFLGRQTPAEAREQARIDGLLDAWEAWDLNGTETLLRLRLQRNAKEDH